MNKGREACGSALRGPLEKAHTSASRQHCEQGAMPTPSQAVFPEQSAASFRCGLLGWPVPYHQELQTSLRKVFPSCVAKNERTLERTLYLSIFSRDSSANLPLLPGVFPRLPPFAAHPFPMHSCIPHPPFSHLLLEAFPAPTPSIGALWLCHKYIYNQV